MNVVTVTAIWHTAFQTSSSFMLVMLQVRAACYYCNIRLLYFNTATYSILILQQYTTSSMCSIALASNDKSLHHLMAQTLGVTNVA